MADRERAGVPPAARAPSALGAGHVEDGVVHGQGDDLPGPDPPVVLQRPGEGRRDDGAGPGPPQVAAQRPIPPAEPGAVRRAGPVLGDRQPRAPAPGRAQAHVDPGEHRVGVHDVGDGVRAAQLPDGPVVKVRGAPGRRAGRGPISGRDPPGHQGDVSAHDDDPVLDVDAQPAPGPPGRGRCEGDNAHPHAGAPEHARLVAEEGAVVGVAPIGVPRGGQDQMHLSPPRPGRPPRRGRPQRPAPSRPARDPRPPRTRPRWPPSGAGGRRSRGRPGPP